MPFPWKKHTISRFLADLRSPSKCDGSLIADTGFPASLVDLFVKSRDRLLNSSAENHSPRRWIGHSPPPPAEAPAVLIRPNGGANYSDKRSSNEVIGELSAKSVIVVAVKSFAVVALALSTKSLIVGFTFSAILLLLLEFVGKPLSNAIQSLLGLIRRRTPFLNPRKGQRRLEKCKRLVSAEIGECYESIAAEVEEEVESDPVYNKHSRRHRLKTKIIKRLQALKKISEGSGHLSTDHVNEDCTEQELGLQTSKSNEESRASWSCGSSPVTSEAGGGRRRVNSGFLMLILIVLVGLVDGRVWAFVLTLVWCLIMQFLGTP